MLRAWKMAWSMALYRETVVLSNMRSRLLTGFAIFAVQIGFLAIADRVRRAHPDWFSDTYACDGVVFLLTLAPSVLAVAIVLFALGYFRHLKIMLGIVVIEDVIAEGAAIEQGLRRWDRQKNEEQFTPFRQRAMTWQRETLPACLESNATLHAAFTASRYVPERYESTWGFAEQWVPAIDRDVCRLREALAIVRPKDGRSVAHVQPA